MSIIDLNQLIGLSLLDIAPAESGAVNARQDSSTLFDDFLLQAQNSSINTGSNDTSNSRRDTWQSSAPRAEDPHPTAAPPPRRDNTEDDVNANHGAESAGKTNLPEPENQQLENKKEPVEQEKAVSQTNKEEEEDNKRDKRDNLDSSPMGQNQNNQPQSQLNPEAAKTNSKSQLGKNISTTETGIKKIANSSHLGAKGAKTTTDSATLTKAEALTANAPQTTGVDKGDATVSTPMKGKTPKKNTFRDEKKTEKPSVEQASETTPVSGETKSPAAKKFKDVAASTHNAQGKTAHQNEPSTASVAEATALPADTQNASAGATTVNTAALQAVSNVPVTLTKPAEDKIDARTTNIASNDKSADPINALSRLEQSAGKTAATTSQAKGEESGSELNSVRFVQRVERAFAAMGDRGGIMRLKLSPPELGSVRIEITINKGQMKARLEAETKEAKNLLLENLPALRERLAQQNIKIQKFDVDLRDPSSGGMFQQTANQADTGSGGGGYRAPRPQTRENNAEAAPTMGTTRLTDHNGQLNVIV
jgi:flagellar hook-length control protein FliK